MHTSIIRSFFSSKALADGGQLALALALLASLVFSAANVAPVVAADGDITLEPITWNVIGLDSNNVNVGPSNFPVGAQVCNTTAIARTGVTVTFNWEDGNDKYTGDPYINLRPGTLDELTLDVPANTCVDAYFEAAVTRNSSAYDNTRGYYITAVSGSDTVSTPRPRELYVEYLISQSRNSVNDMQLSADGGATYASIPNGGTMDLMVGQTYFIKLVGQTATNGYEQIESFINFPNTIFQVLSVETDYSADTSATVDDPSDMLYGDGCVWVNNPLSPNYRSCLSTGKAGGSIIVTYEVKILQVPGAPLVNPEPLTTLIYDFSGSSYHYNADFSSTARYANIINANIKKSFAPKLILPGGTSTLTFTIENPGPAAITDLNFDDDLPGGLEIEGTTVTYSNCGTPSPSSLTDGATSLSFSGITVAGNSSCTIAVTVTAPSNGNYDNVSDPLYIGTTNTGSVATDRLSVSSNPPAPSSCDLPHTMATWNFGTGSPGTLTPTITPATNAPISTASASSSGGSFTIDTTLGNPANSWQGTGWSTTQGTSTVPYPPSPLTYYQFEIDSSNYGGLSIAFDYYAPTNNWGQNANNWFYIYSDTTTGTPAFASGSGVGYNFTKSNNWNNGGSPVTINAVSTGNSVTRFFITAYGANTSGTPILKLDNVIITGCQRPDSQPTLSKAFEPATIAQGAVSTLTFTFTNPNSITLDRVSFEDVLPEGLRIASPNGLTAISCNTGSVTNAAIAAVAGTSTISLAGVASTVGASMPANSSCSFSVDVVGIKAGKYTNITSSIQSTAGINTTSTGYGVDDLTVTAPVISKTFSPNPIVSGGTSTLTFTLTNPFGDSITSVAFSDTYPTGVTNTDPLSASATCTGGSITAAAGGGSVGLSGASLAVGETCTVLVAVTSSTTTGSLTGTLGVTNGSPDVTGSGTNFDPEVPVGGALYINGVRYQVASVASDTSLKLMTPYSGATASGLTVPGGHFNVSGAVSYTLGGNSYEGNIASDTLKVKAVTPALSLMKQVSNTSTGPWRDSVIIAPGDTVYYKFTVENIGDVALTDITTTDPLVSTSGCTWPSSLPAPDSNDDDHIVTCVVNLTTPITASAGSVTNTAYATGAYSGSDYNSDEDTATYINGNFGNLPNSYPYLNLYNEGGAMHLNGSTYLGASVTTTAIDGADNATLVPRATDNGVVWTGTWQSGSGTASLTATCDPSGTRTVYGWFDWNNDKDFEDTNEAQSWTVNCSPTGTTNSIAITYPASLNNAENYLTEGTYYTRFRIYDSAPAGNIYEPNGLAVDASGEGIVGEIEDYALESAGDSSTPTPVTLSYFQAERRGANVTFEWSTATETGNVGFNLYVVDADGQSTQVNPELIASAVVDSVERQDYTYRAKVSGDVFYIEDVSIWGEIKRHGPFEVDQVYGERIEAERINHAAIAREVNQKAAVRQTELRKEMKLPAVALRESTVALPQGSQLTSTVNILVNQTGIQRVTYEALRDAGLNLNRVPANKIAVMNRGQVVPVRVEARGKFGPGSYIEFYGEALDTLYTDTNIYTLQVVNRPAGNAGRIPTVNKPVNNRAQPATYYMETLVVDEQRHYTPSLPISDPWYDTLMQVRATPRTWNFSFEVDALVTTSPARISVMLFGLTNAQRHFKLSINGANLSDDSFVGYTEYEMVADIPPDMLLEGTNTMTLTATTGAASDVVVLDKYRLTYPRKFMAESGRLTFTAVGEIFKVTNLSSSDVFVYRLTERGLTRLTWVSVKREDGTFSATFAGGKESATYLVTTTAATNHPALEPTRLKVDLNQPADFLIISHPHFIDGLAPLVAARRVEGLTVNVVNVEDLYAQYSYGVLDPYAIQSHIRHAATNLGAKYVLLVGGDTRDYRNYTGNGQISFIPSLYARTSPTVMSVPVDPLYTDLTGDGLPNLAIGRFPVRSQAELALLVQKTLAYGQKDYGGTAVFASDKRDSTVSFKNISRGMEVRMPAGWSVEGIHLDDLAIATARMQLTAAMNRGTALVTFTGHSGPTAWTFNSLFTTSHAASLTNAGRPFVAVQWGCWNTYYVNPVAVYLQDSLLFSGDKGAAAVLGAVTLTESRSEQLLGDLLTPRMVQPGVRMGDALQSSKADLVRTNPELLDVLLGWTLMGDPTLVIQP